VYADLDTTVMQKPLRIAQIAPLSESVPPQLYGGTERVVAHLTDELVRQGHHVTLFASGDSRTNATLVPAWPRALRLSGESGDFLTFHLLLVEMVARRADEFDVLHFHIAHAHESAARRLDTPHVTTMHGRLDLPGLVPLYRELSDVPLVSISNAQRRPLSHANWIGTVHHGLPPALLPFRAVPDNYLAFLGRISPEKRVDRAIAIATACGMPLRIAAKVDPADRDYFRRDIEPLLHHPLVEFVGEIGEADKGEFLGRARALLFPIDWPEPFGLVMIEAMRCGTPVIAWDCGSVREVIDEGVSGFVVDNMDDAVRTVGRAGELDRRGCRAVFDKRFSAERMAHDYVAVYKRLIGQGHLRGKLESGDSRRPLSIG
jgi:glycosyltransferase involved in cell wall biosynthesis